MKLDVARRRMVEEQLERRGIRDPSVLAVMRDAPRHVFVEEAFRDQAYGDHALPLAGGQTISQPYMVALMTEALRPDPGVTVLELGTGSGYQTYVLSRLVRRVFTVERVPELARRARALLDLLGVENVASRVSDGSWGWREYAPFDRILVTAAADALPRPLVSQLAPGGILVIPLGTRLGPQALTRFTREPAGLRSEELCGCTFVPLIGSASAYAPGEEKLPADAPPPAPADPPPADGDASGPRGGERP